MSKGCWLAVLLLVGWFAAVAVACSVGLSASTRPDFTFTPVVSAAAATFNAAVLATEAAR